MSNNEAISEKDETIPVVQVGHDLFDADNLKCLIFTNKRK